VQMGWELGIESELRLGESTADALPPPGQMDGSYNHKRSIE